MYKSEFIFVNLVDFSQLQAYYVSINKEGRDNILSNFNWEKVKEFSRGSTFYEYYIDFSDLPKAGKVCAYYRSVGRAISFMEVQDKNKTFIIECKVVSYDIQTKRIILIDKKSNFVLPGILISNFTQGKISSIFNLIEYRCPWMKDYLKNERDH